MVELGCNLSYYYRVGKFVKVALYYKKNNILLDDVSVRDFLRSNNFVGVLLGFILLSYPRSTINTGVSNSRYRTISIFLLSDNTN